MPRSGSEKRHAYRLDATASQRMSSRGGSATKRSPPMLFAGGPWRSAGVQQEAAPDRLTVVAPFTSP